MKLIAGLGNPGRAYTQNRHNIGFMCVNHFARMQGISFDKKQGKARTGAGEISGGKVVLARPQTYMNSSGESVSRLVKKFNLKPDDMIVIHDDLDLPLGKIRIRYGGSAAGHKGINSIITQLGTQNFYRIRIGIGRPEITAQSAREKEAAVIDYVLSDFTAEERKIVSGVIPEVSQAILCLLNDGLTAAMSRYN